MTEPTIISGIEPKYDGPDAVEEYAHTETPGIFVTPDLDIELDKGVWDPDSDLKTFKDGFNTSSRNNIIEDDEIDTRW